MRAGDQDIVRGHPVEDTQPASLRGDRIEIVFHGDVRRRQMNVGDMNEIAPSKDGLAARLDEPTGVPRRVAGRRMSRYSGKDFVVFYAVQTARIKREDLPCRIEVAAGALGHVLDAPSSQKLASCW